MPLFLARLPHEAIVVKLVTQFSSIIPTSRLHASPKDFSTNTVHKTVSHTRATSPVRYTDYGSVGLTSFRLTHKSELKM